MFITDRETLKQYTSEHRLWQGIPSIAVSKGGRIFLTFYSGGKDEEIGNFSMVLQSDNGVDFTEPIAVADMEEHRCFDPCLWIDPLGRLWFTWALMPDHGVYAAICDDPDAETLTWRDPIRIGGDVMMNKPTVLTSGEWMFPLASWQKNAFFVAYDSPSPDTGAFVYRSADQGKTFVRTGGTEMPKRLFDEHMILELNDGRLAMYVRTSYGIGVSYSYDRGTTWTQGVDSGLGGPCSRFHICRLRSGRILLINHYNYTGRNNLTAMLSEDEGRTWPYRLLLDERREVSYPDAQEAEDGFIYITYDRERGYNKTSMDEVYGSAREILYAKITESDIMAGTLTNPESRLKTVATKLGKFAEESLYMGENNGSLFNKTGYHRDLAAHLLEEDPDRYITRIFEIYPINCAKAAFLDRKKVDSLIEQAKDPNKDRIKAMTELLDLVRNASKAQSPEPIVDLIKNLLLTCPEEDLSIKEIAERLNVSEYYMMHQFKKVTGITVTDYKISLKLTKAKQMLIATDQDITQIAHACGFCSSGYFAKIFRQSEQISPSEYRKLMTGKQH